MIVTGTMLAYYSICHRKLWFFLHNVEQEHNSDAVMEGRYISETCYNRNKKEISIPGIAIDFLDMKKKIVHEIKKTDALEYAHILQLQYYLFVLEEYGVTGFTGLIDYPKLRKREVVLLNDDTREIIRSIRKDILMMTKTSNPPMPISHKLCRNCSYYDLCFV